MTNFARILNLDLDKVNVHGGAVALGKLFTIWLIHTFTVFNLQDIQLDLPVLVLLVS
jgi:hypothetical protein